MMFFDRQKSAMKLMEKTIAGLKPDDWAIDCGANVGKYSVRIANRNANLLAYEPDPNVFQILKQRLSAYPKATPIEAAVGLNEDTVKLYFSPYYSEDPVLESIKNTLRVDALTADYKGGATPIDTSNSFDVKLVNILTIIENLLEKHGKIALLKMDIEGAEVEILEELDRLNIFKRIGLTITELHPRWFPHEQTMLDDLRARFSKKYSTRHVNLDWI